MNPNPNAILRWIHMVLGNIVWKYNIKDTNIYENYPGLDWLISHIIIQLEIFWTHEQLIMNPNSNAILKLIQMVPGNTVYSNGSDSTELLEDADTVPTWSWSVRNIACSSIFFLRSPLSTCNNCRCISVKETHRDMDFRNIDTCPWDKVTTGW